MSALAVRTEDVPLDPRGRQTNLPLQLTTFVGRERELAELERLLATTRLLTLTGAGGVGKTRLVLCLADEMLEHHPDGVWLVELASLADPALVPYSAAATLGVPQAPGQQLIGSVVEQLQPRHILVVLDNCEHVVQVCAELADRLLRACPRLRLLATSRQPLGVAGEVAWRVPPLTVPDPSVAGGTDEIAASDAVRLFCDRARLVAPRWRLVDHNAAAVADVCRSLDGVPLAIELAAARLSVLSVEQIAGRLTDRFGLLVGSSRTAPPRQQTLRAVVAWSHDLLTEQERVQFRRLAVFAGGWTLDAAEAICAGDGLEREELLPLMARLIEQSLVLAEDDPAGERCYRLLETLRAYARERLAEAGELAPVQARTAGGTSRSGSRLSGKSVAPPGGLVRPPDCRIRQPAGGTGGVPGDRRGGGPAAGGGPHLVLAAARPRGRRTGVAGGLARARTSRADAAGPRRGAGRRGTLWHRGPATTPRRAACSSGAWPTGACWTIPRASRARCAPRRSPPTGEGTSRASSWTSASSAAAASAPPPWPATSRSRTWPRCCPTRSRRPTPCPAPGVPGPGRATRRDARRGLCPAGPGPPGLAAGRSAPCRWPAPTESGHDLAAGGSPVHRALPARAGPHGQHGRAACACRAAVRGGRGLARRHRCPIVPPRMARP
ncbi:MAG: AAA family ATPase [Chloroflexi bacterium]|nr:AAA family ATPase [Chloroflexota bacterium]